MEIKQGESYRCIKDVVMSGHDAGNTTYYKGKVYPSRFTGYITNEDGNEFHAWNEALAEDYFDPKPVDVREMTECVVCDETKLVHDVCVDCVTPHSELANEEAECKHEWAKLDWDSPTRIDCECGESFFRFTN